MGVPLMQWPLRFVGITHGRADSGGRGGPPPAGLHPLAPLGTQGARGEFVGHVPGVFAAKPEIVAPISRGVAPWRIRVAKHSSACKAFERIRTIFLSDLPLASVRQFDVEFITPAGHSRRAHVQETGDLRIGERLHLDCGPQECFARGASTCTAFPLLP